MTAPLADAEARRAIATALDETLIVEAAAGTGKTTALVGRVIALLVSGRARISSLVCVTFTEKAAGEMKLRLRTEIERARADADDAARGRLDVALEELEAAHIGTIHGFCADLLRERPVEALVDPLFEMAAEEQSGRLYDEAFSAWFQEALADPSEGVARVLRHATKERDREGPRHLLSRAGWQLVGQRDFPAPYTRPAFDRARSMREVVASLRELADLAPLGPADNYLTKSLERVARTVYEIDRRAEELGGAEDLDGIEALLRELARERSWGWRGKNLVWFDAKRTVRREDVLASRATAKDALDRLIDAANADLAALLSRELAGAVERYEELKKRAGKLDFLDLLLKTRELLGRDATVRAELQRRFTHLLVDEFQDTDPLQAEILLLLAADDPAASSPDRVRTEPGKLFLVGDPKQSIYRFRRADVSLYQRIKARLEGEGARVVHLTTSFRSVPSIQRFVNAAFHKAMVASPSQADYVPLSPFRDEARGRPSVIALPVPRPYNENGYVTKYLFEDSFPDAVGAFIDFLIHKSGWKVTERDRAEPVPVEARHVCLLFKRLHSFGRDVSRPYLRALESRRIAHILVGGRSFHDREEVVALRNVLSALEWPDDLMSVYASLRGPFFAIGDDAILAFRSSQGHLHPLRHVDEGKLTDLTRPVRDCLDVLARLHAGRNRRPLADTIARFLEETRAHAGVAIWPSGEQALANVLRLLDVARRFEQAGATSFRAFVTKLAEDAERGGATEAPVVEEGTDGVRIMTVHKAKGLEFPVVVLVDPTATLSQREPSRWIDPERKLWAAPLAGAAPLELLERRDEVLAQDREESVRLLYVATTRARELLVVPAVADGPIEDSWLGPLDVALYPAENKRRASRPAEGCPAFGDDAALDRPSRAARTGSVRPGAHTIDAHEVVFWDPHTLSLAAEEASGLRQQKLLAADDDRTVADEGIRAHAAWREGQRAAIARASTPSVLVHKATDAVATGRASDVTFEHVPDRDDARPRGKRFGTLVHATLASVPLDASEDVITSTARTQARIVGATDEERDAATRAVAAALAHPWMRRAARSERVERECPVMTRAEDGSFVEGVVDLAFVDDDGAWLVVDFKTDREVASAEATYAAQVHAYTCAIAEATGARAKGAILVV